MAEQEEPVRRRVALKVIKLGMDTKQVIARFEAERQALALMDHPNIAKVLDGGATDTGRPYFVMELVQGVPITAFCDNNKLTARERLKLFVQVCQAIQSAHQKGIIHRDIKPSNVLVTLPNGEPMAKVIDFGIAKAINQKLTEKTLFTSHGALIGTPAYTSPEQAEMSSMDVDTRTDVYSLGVLLYELLTGSTPFPENRLRSMGYGEMQRVIMEEEPERPSTRLSAMSQEEKTAVVRSRGQELSSLSHLLKGDLDWIVMKCLEKDRRRRYETANGLSADIRRHLNNEAVVARPPSAAYRLQKLVRRNKLVFAATALIATVLFAATCISAWQAVRATRAETLAKQRLTESEAISRFLKEVFQSPDPARDARSITVADSLRAAAKKLETDLATQPARRAKLQATLGLTYQALGLPREAIPLQEGVRNYFMITFGLEHPETISAMDDLSRSYDEAGRRDEALKLREQVLALRRKVLGRERRETLLAMHHLAISYDEAGRRAEALKLREEVLALSRKVLGPEHPDTLKVMHNLATSYDEAGRPDEALKLREEVFTRSKNVFDAEHPQALAAMHNLATSYAEAGQPEYALKLREEVLALSRKVLGPEHSDTLKVMHNLATSYDEVGRPDEALKLREEVLALSRKVLGPEHPDTLKAMRNLAISYVGAGRQAEALKLRGDVLALYRKVLGPEHPETLMAITNLAIFYTDAPTPVAKPKP
jgi:tetratricopeptide (TPR) repeat protein